MGSLDEAVDGLREVLVFLQGLTLWPPQAVAQEIVNADRRAVNTAHSWCGAGISQWLR